MTEVLQQSAAATVQLGPFVDATDGVTPETGLAGTMTVRVFRGGSWNARSSAAAIAHEESGYYSVPLDATDTGTLGSLIVAVSDSATHVPVQSRFQVTATGLSRADVGAISEDTAAADNLEATYDGTGYADSEAPATQGAVATLTAASTSLSALVSADNFLGPLNGVTFVGSIASGSILDLPVADDVGITVDNSGNQIDYVTQVDLPLTAVPLSIQFTGYVNSSNDSCLVQVYDFDGAAWVTRATIAGQNGTTTITLDIPLGESRFASSGVVYVRFNSATGSSQSLFLDRVTVGYLNQSAGYANGLIYVDTADGVAGTTRFVNGTVDNPVDTLADAVTLDASLSLNAFFIRAGSSIALTQNFTGQVFVADRVSLDMAARQVDDCIFRGFLIAASTGTVSSDAAPATFEDCTFGVGGTTILGPMKATMCAFLALQANAAGSYRFVDCYSDVPGTSAPVFDLAGFTINCEFRRWSGGLALNNVTVGCNVSVDAVSGGTITVNGTGGTVAIRGLVNVVDGSGGAVTIVQTSAVNNTSVQGDVQVGLTGQGYTIARAALLDFLDVAVSGVPASVVSQAVPAGPAVGSVGEALAVARGRELYYRFDNFTRDANGFATAARLRIFPNSATAAASTDGGSGEGEIAMVTVAGTPDGTFNTLPSSVRGS